MSWKLHYTASAPSERPDVTTACGTALESLVTDANGERPWECATPEECGYTFDPAYLLKIEVLDPALACPDCLVIVKGM